MPPNQLDPVSVAVMFASLLVGQQMAPFVGTYSVIIFAWLGGVLIGLMRKETYPRGKTAMFVIITFILTIGVTWPAAMYLATRVSIEATYLLFPIAVLVPAVGEDWFTVIRWGIKLWKGRFEREAGEPKP